MERLELMSGSPLISNVLAERYASAAMRGIWSREAKIRNERKFWIAVMRAQASHGLDISPEDIEKYEVVLNEVDLSSIDKRERQLRHDVKARIEEFNDLAGLQLIHLGMTSRDLTENVEMVQIRDSLLLIQGASVGVLKILGKRIEEYADLVMVGRSHNVPAQLTTFGKRLATIAEELLFSLERLEQLISRLPLRGLRGPVGTGQDLHDLVGENSRLIERQIASDLDFDRSLTSTGQIYPRSIDFEVVSTLVQLAAAPSNFALLIRLMSGNELISEGFKAGQVGSSAMPHKMNARSSERINGLSAVLKGYLTMIGELTGNQWNEGDVSCSVVRRVALPDAFFALDGIFQTMATIVREFVVFDDVVRMEVSQQLPFTSTTRLLMEAVKRGVGREDAHSIIQKHSISALEKIRSGESHAFFEDIGTDQFIPISTEEAVGIACDFEALIGDAKAQTREVLAKIDHLHAASNYQFEEVR